MSYFYDVSMIFSYRLQYGNLNIIEQLRNDVPIIFYDIYKRDKKIKLYQNPFLVHIPDVNNSSQMEIVDL